MKKLIYILSSLVVLVFIAIMGISTYIGYTMTSRGTVNDEFNYRADQEEFTVQTSDNLKLSGVYLDNKADTSVIFVHGYHDNLVQSGRVKLIVDQYGEKYNYLNFDLRAHGKSEGSKVTFGQDEKLDVMAVIDYAKTRYPDNKIILWGYSMGAATSLQTLAIDNEQVINAVIADSPYSDLNKFLDENLSVWTGMPEFPFNATTTFITKYLRGIDINEVDIENKINSKVPILLVHSRGDKDINYQNSVRIYEKIKDNNPLNKLVLVDGYGHCKYITENPDEYFQMTDKWLASLQ